MLGVLGTSVLGGCSDRPADGAGRGADPSAASATAAASASARPVPNGTAGAESRDPLLGRWTASYRAGRAAVDVPRGLPAKTWQGDDGASAVGEGRIELQVEQAGQVRGTAEGPLGKLVLRGVVDGDVLRVGVTPAEPSAEPAFGGVLVAVLEQGLFVGELRVANGDGTLVRAATLRLSRPDASRANPPAATAEPTARP
jgi:hypothetical protein